jgi:hypothetical protein
MSSYEEFLAKKESRHASVGRDVELGLIHESLHEWQKRIVQTTLKRGRGAVFADTGLGKTRMQIEWSRLMGKKSLILAPLSVARQTVREAQLIGVDVSYVRRPEHVTDGVSITNYELAHHFDPDEFDSVALDESSILKSFTGSTRNALIKQWRNTQYRSSWSATPAPNDVIELCNQAEFLGIMPRNEMLAAYFVHDQEGWRVKRHAVDPMFRWMSTWAIALRHPSDISGDDSGYILPPLRMHQEAVRVTVDSGDQLFATDLGGVGGRAKVRKNTLNERVGRVSEICSRPGQWIAWCGLNDEANQVSKNVSGAVNVEGSMTPDEKADAFEAFQDGEIRVLVTKPSIAGFGLNFQNCHQMCFVGLSDSWESYYQSVRRCWRFGQTEPVDVFVVVSELEQQITENILRKENETSEWTDRLISAMKEREFVA